MFFFCVLQVISGEIQLSFSGGTLEYSYVIPHDHHSGTFWYHPHYHGSGGLQLAGGMAGAIIVLDREDSKTEEKYEDIILVFQVD